MQKNVIIIMNVMRIKTKKKFFRLLFGIGLEIVVIDTSRTPTLQLPLRGRMPELKEYTASKAVA